MELCKKQFSVKVGTIFEDSPLGLDKWLPAVWMIVNCKNGVSSCEIARALEITQKSAWFMLHRIRIALTQGNFENLSGMVEAGETFIGGKAKNMHKPSVSARYTGRGAVGEAVVMGILERGEEYTDKHGETKKPSKVKTNVIADTSREALHSEVKRNVAPGSSLIKK